MTPIEILQKYPHLRAAGMNARQIAQFHHNHGSVAAEDKTFHQCPKCLDLHERVDGNILMYCHCGYCRHASVRGNPDGSRVCEHCDAKDPEPIMPTPAHEAVFAADVAIKGGSK